jgi:N-acylneuraminate cytidylyltransferase
MSPPTGIVALVPARAGSKRVPGKNLRELGGHPLLAYTIAAALRSEVFDRVLVSTEDATTADVARRYGAEAPFLRPAEFAGDLSPDIDWVTHAVTQLRSAGVAVDMFAILRPTSPLRTPQTIAGAVRALLDDEAADSLRAVEKVSQHPAKMWVISEAGDRMTALLDDGGATPPWHSRPYQGLPPVYVQNASLEVARIRCLDRDGTIAGRVVRPWISPGLEGFDVNHEHDWDTLERLIGSGQASLPEIAPVPATTQPRSDG